MNSKDTQILARQKANLQRRLDRRHAQVNCGGPMLSDANVRYEVGERVRAIGCGGIGAIHKMVVRLGLPDAINRRLHLLKAHLPYHESDHVLNIAYNVLTGGACLEDIELLRQDEVYLDALGTQRIPDPTTAGDFTRRFENEEAVVQLQEAINEVRRKVWNTQPQSFHKQAILDVDGTIAPTTGECKEGMGLSYKGAWGCAPLVVSLANTREPIYLVNRPGNEPSHSGAAEWIDRGIACVRESFESVLLRGDTDFSLTRHFDRWDEEATFIFGYDAKKNLIERAESLVSKDWRHLERRPRYRVKTERRSRPENVKERIVREKEYKNIRLVEEEVAEFPYQPTWCKKPYRMVVVRKDLTCERGERWLFDDVRYFFYVTNDWESAAEEIVYSANDRCDQENLIAQLKGGVGAMRMPVGDLNSNWAYMVMAALAWTLKAWWALMMPENERERTVRLEFRSFVQRYIRIPCQIVQTGRRLVYRIVAYTSYLEPFLLTFERMQRMKFA